MKKAIGVIMALVMVISAFTVYAAASGLPEPEVEVKGESVALKAPPLIEKGRMLVPLNGVFEKLHAEVAFDKATNKISIEDKYTTVVLTLDDAQALVYKKFDFTGLPLKASLEVAPRLVDGQVYIPLRFVAESLGLTVEWNAKTRTASLKNANDVTPVESTVEYKVITEADIQNNARLTQWYQKNAKIKGISYNTIEQTTYVLISAGEKPTGGYSLDIESITMVTPGSLYVTAKLNKPAPDAMVTMALTYPNLLIKLENTAIDKVDGDIQE
ncbi:MAG: stalk domain-containing protein [Clostridia bacterium]|nr:stalk domain-containing protein [Clostridia bacterium]